MHLRREGILCFRSAVLESNYYLELSFSEKTTCPNPMINEGTEYPLFSILPRSSGQKEIHRVFSMLFRLLPFGHLESLDADDAMFDYADALESRPHSIPTQFTAVTWRRVLSLLPNKMYVSMGVNYATVAMLEGLVQVMRSAPIKGRKLKRTRPI